MSLEQCVHLLGNALGNFLHTFKVKLPTFACVFEHTSFRCSFGQVFHRDFNHAARSIFAHGNAFFNAVDNQRFCIHGCPFHAALRRRIAALARAVALRFGV